MFLGTSSTKYLRQIKQSVNIPSDNVALLIAITQIGKLRKNDFTHDSIIAAIVVSAVTTIIVVMATLNRQESV